MNTRSRKPRVWTKFNQISKLPHGLYISPLSFSAPSERGHGTPLRVAVITFLNGERGWSEVGRG
jgi:hypothetical protein